MGRILLITALAAALAGILGWQFNLFQTGPDDPSASSGASQPKVDLEKLGGPLYPPAKDLVQGRELHPVPKGVDPIVFAGTLQEIDKIDVPSQVAGQVLYIGDGVPEGVTQVCGIAPFMHDGYEQAAVTQGGRDIIKFYRPLGKGDPVVAGQIVAEIDFAKALNLYLTHKSLLDKAKAELKWAEAVSVASSTLYNMTRSIAGVSATREVIEAQIMHTKALLDITKTEKEMEKEIIELDNALNLLAFHELRFRLPVKSGYNKMIYHLRGEAVKENEPVLHIYSTDRLMAEAFIEAQHAHRLSQTMIATLEPAQDEAPARMFEGHRGNAAITGVAFAALDSKLYVVSTGEDGFLKLWHKDYKGAIASMNHREPIRAMAAWSNPRAAKQALCAAGTGDGKIHLTTLLPDKHLPRLAKHLDVPIDAHRDSVTALAFSPDGTMFASGAADGTIKLWYVDEGKLKYAFDPAHGADNPHQGAITALAFTPHSRLVSASRDNTLRVWNLCEKGAYLEGLPITGRSGTVNQLGVSQDGRWMLFDQGKSLQFMNVPDGEPVNTLKNPGGTTPFETLALFSPDASFVLTGGAPEGRLQLWRAPSGANRGYEVRQFVTEQRSPVTCAAFAPTTGQTGETAFAASGTKDGFVYLWPVLSKQDADNHRITNVPVRLFSRAADTSRQLRIGVEVPNPTGRLMPGRPVTIVME
jgi:WD40 repeat protein